MHMEIIRMLFYLRRNYSYLILGNIFELELCHNINIKQSERPKVIYFKLGAC